MQAHAVTLHTISFKGKPTRVPCLQVGNTRIVVTGRFIRLAVIHDEEWLEPSSLPNPSALLEALQSEHFNADIFSFIQRVPDVQPKYPYTMEWDNSAVIPITTYSDWWSKLPQVARRNVRTAEKKGVEVRIVPYDDDLVHGITSLYNESPIRHGKRFWHFGKDFYTVKTENETYLDRSAFVGAFFEKKLIGFIKLVFVGQIGSLMQILSMIQHQDKRTTNALIAKAVEICESKRMSHLMYCRYVYDTNESSLLTDFKRRNGFERVNFPRYYVPLSTRGRIALSTKAHHGIKGLLPPIFLKFALQARAKYYSLSQRRNIGAID